MMEDRNELNDIILNRSSGSMGSNKKIVFAVGVLAAILIAVVMIMKTSVSSSTDNLPQAQQAAKTNLQPEPPTPQANDDQQANTPLFKPVEIIKENKKSDDDLDKIAQKLKQESLSKDTIPTPVEESPVTPIIEPHKVAAPVVKENAHVIRQRDVQKKEASEKKEAITKKESNVKKEPVTKKEVSEKKESPDKKDSLFAKVNTPKKESLSAKEPKSESKTSPSGTYYVQVGSFTKITPSEKFFASIKNLGYAYESVKIGETSKVMVGPFKDEADARNALKAIRKDVVSGAFITTKK
jgi:DedD protein